MITQTAIQSTKRPVGRPKVHESDAARAAAYRARKAEKLAEQLSAAEKVLAAPPHVVEKIVEKIVERPAKPSKLEASGSKMIDRWGAGEAIRTKAIGKRFAEDEWRGGERAKRLATRLATASSAIEELLDFITVQNTSQLRR